MEMNYSKIKTVMKLSVVIPSYNEETTLSITINSIYETLLIKKIEHEIIVINDNSKDRTEQILKELQETIVTLNYYNNSGLNGFGNAVRYGLERITGDCVCIMMADLSDSPDDLVSFYNELYINDLDCVFGSRFMKGSKVKGYPKKKLIMNRITNYIIMLVVGIRYNDCTNAFKIYKKETLEGLKPFLASQFNFALELPLKAIGRGYSYKVIPNSWTNRTSGESKLNLSKMFKKYVFILLYCIIEKLFAKEDFKKH